MVIKYIGQTIDPVGRIATHYKNSEKVGQSKNDDLYGWIRDLLNVGVEPYFDIIDTCDRSVSIVTEGRYIQKYKHLGLFNKILLGDPSTIDRDRLKRIIKEKGIKITSLSTNLGICQSGISTYLTKLTSAISHTNALRLEEYLLNL